MSCLGGLGVGEAHGAARGAFQRPMHGARISHEIRTCPRVVGKEVVRQEIAFQGVTAKAGENDVSGMMSAAMREGVHMVEGRGFKVERSATIDAASPAVAHGRAFDRALVPGASKCGDPGTLRTGGTRKSC